MYPLVGEVYLHAVNVVHLFALVHLLDLSENSVHVGLWCKVDAVLGDEVGRIGGTKLAGCHALLGHIGQDESDAYKSVAAVMGSRIDDATVAFAADDSVCLFHLRHDVHFAHGCCVVLAAIFAGDVAQGTGGAEVADRVAGCVLQDVVGHRDECIFFAVHRAVFAEEGEAVNVGVNDEGNVVLAFLHQSLDVGQVLLEGFGVMLEVAGRFGEEACDGLHAELFQELRQDDAADAVDAVEGDAEVCLLDGFHIHKVEAKHHVDVLLVVGVVFAIRTKVIDVGVLEVFCFSDAEHFVAFLFVEELAAGVEQLQGVPHAWIVAGCDDDAAAGAFHGDGNFGGGRRGEADVDHVEAHAHERAADHILDHRSGDACVATDNNLVALYRCGAADECSVSRCEFHDVEGVERIACPSSDGASDARDGFDKSHGNLQFDDLRFMYYLVIRLFTRG